MYSRAELIWRTWNVKVIILKILLEILLKIMYFENGGFYALYLACFRFA